MTLKEKFLNVEKKQLLETGVVLMLAGILLGIYRQPFPWLQLAFVSGVLTLLLPRVFYPLAVGWFGLGHVLGMVSSRVLLTVLFVGLVIPVALVRKRFGKDSLRLRQFKQGRDSVFITRNHTYRPTDLQHPF